MTIAEKLRFLADRAEDEKQFYISCYLCGYKNGKLMLISIYPGTGLPFYERVISLDEALLYKLKLKPQWEFTEDEKVILRNLSNEFQWIARDKSVNQLYAYSVKPTKENARWWSGVGSVNYLNIFKHLFQSIQWSDDEPCEFRKYI